MCTPSANSRRATFRSERCRILGENRYHREILKKICESASIQKRLSVQPTTKPHVQTRAAMNRAPQSCRTPHSATRGQATHRSSTAIRARCGWTGRAPCQHAEGQVGSLGAPASPKCRHAPADDQSACLCRCSSVSSTATSTTMATISSPDAARTSGYAMRSGGAAATVRLVLRAVLWGTARTQCG